MPHGSSSIDLRNSSQHLDFALLILDLNLRLAIRYSFKALSSSPKESQDFRFSLARARRLTIHLGPCIRNLIVPPGHRSLLRRTGGTLFSLKDRIRASNFLSYPSDSPLCQASGGEGRGHYFIPKKTRKISTSILLYAERTFPLRSPLGRLQDSDIIANIGAIKKSFHCTQNHRVYELVQP